MADSSEAIREKDEPPAAHSPKTDANVESGASREIAKEPPRDAREAEEERDDSGLPVRPKPKRLVDEHESDSEDEEAQAYGTPHEKLSRAVTPKPPQANGEKEVTASEKSTLEQDEEKEAIKLPPTPAQLADQENEESNSSMAENPPPRYKLTDAADRPKGHAHNISANAEAPKTVVNEILRSQPGPFSEHSHQALAPKKINNELEKEDEDEWKTMPAFAPYDLYDDDNRLVAREEHDSEDESNAYSGLGGAGKGYTRVQVDEDAKSATSMDNNTDYLFKSKAGTELHDEEEDQRDPLAQLQATKTLLSETQRIAYAGMTRLAIAKMVEDLDRVEVTKKTKKEKTVAMESIKMWSQKMMVRLYGHMDISSSEQVMIEQLSEHGVEMGDMTPALMQNARVKNPMAEEKGDEFSTDEVQADSTDDPKNDVKDGTPPKSPKLDCPNPSSSSPRLSDAKEALAISTSDAEFGGDMSDDPVPEYQERGDEHKPEDMSPSQLGTGKNIDIDLRWTVLCDLFLVLLADSVYDSRSRVLLERAGEALQVPWIEISRFEKRVTDSLEMQETANKETWDEAEHLENRRKLALKRRYVMMGLATVGGGLVIGLSAGVLAPFIGAGLAAGFTTIGVSGTGAFLTGAGASALITTGAVGIGGRIGINASNRRTGAVKTFEYRPLHNNKRVNLIVTVSGWMSSKVDDVRLPFSTVDSIMGDIYSVLWEPEMLTSMGDTINILASEVCADPRLTFTYILLTKYRRLLHKQSSRFWAAPY